MSRAITVIGLDFRTNSWTFCRRKSLDLTGAASLSQISWLTLTWLEIPQFFGVSYFSVSNVI